MKIGIDGRAANWYRGTGMGTYTYQLIRNLNRIDAKTDYLIFMPDQKHCDIPFGKNFTVKNITENVQGNFWDEVNIPNILAGEELELYHVPQNGVGLPAEKKCPFVITLHDVIPYRMPETCSENYLRVFQTELPQIVERCDGIITVSEFSKQDIIKAFHFPGEKIYVSYLAGEDIYRPLDKKWCKEFLKSNYSISGDFILYVGGFSPRKGIKGVIEAFSKLIEDYKNEIYLVIAGKQGRSYPIYKKLAEDLKVADKVLFPGFIPLEQLPYFYNASKLFVYPSFYEGFGLPPIEAMACGTPVVTSNATSIPEVLGDSALYVNPADVYDLFEKIRQGLEDEPLRETLITKGFQRTKQLTWEDTAKNTLQFYKEIINKR
jgi:glycosyltransferase involved in cell wall biosynthesis